jgi:osmoprotectant transport system permease protein
MHLFIQAIQWLFDRSHWTGFDGIPDRLWQHVGLSLVATALAMAIAVPVGLFVGHTRRGEFLATSVANAARSLPSFGLLALVFVAVSDFFPRLAFGALPTIVALVVLGIPPILTNTYVGVQGVDQDTIEAARGMGMTERQVLLRLEVPLSAGLIMAGLRTAALQIVATATLAALFAGGTLGRYIVDGFAQKDDPKLVAGAILVALLAIATEIGFALVERLVTPRTSSRLDRRRATALTDPIGQAEPAIVGGSS